MMPNFSPSSAFVIFVLVALLSIISSDQAMTGVLAFPQFKSKEEKQKLELHALHGSPEAADKIVSVLGLTESSDGFYWASIAAENASRNGAYSAAVFLSDIGPIDNRLYGIFRQDRKWFWLKKAANEGHALAVYTLKEEFPQAKRMKLEPEKEIHTWILSTKTLSRFKRAAMRGSPAAAYRLYQHYNSPASEAKEDLFWATIAAQNGYPKAPYVVGKLMLKTGKPNDRVRACFWLRKAVATGEKDAAKLLKTACPVEHKK